MSCDVCGGVRKPGRPCEGGYVPYLSGDYPCPYRVDAATAPVRNPRALPPVVTRRPAPEPDADLWTVPAPMSSEGLEDLL